MDVEVLDHFLGQFKAGKSGASGFPLFLFLLYTPIMEKSEFEKLLDIVAEFHGERAVRVTRSGQENPLNLFT